MKLLSEDQKERNIRHSDLEMKRNIRSKTRKTQRHQCVAHYKQVSLEIPTSFNLREGRDDALRFFNQLRQTILIERQMGTIRFRQCNSISAGAGLILAAEVERCRTLRYRDGRPSVTGTYPKDDGVREFLDNLGFFKLLKIYNPRFDSIPASGIRFISMRSGRRDRGEEVHEVAEVTNRGAIQLDPEAKVALYEGLLEAMNNVTSHAYPSEICRKPLSVLPGHWWAAGHWDNDRREISALIYDQGVGIPQTLPKSTHQGILTDIRRRLGLGGSDSECIRAAMEIGKSRHGSQHRGRGMATLRHAVGRVADGHLLILSGAGGYHYASGDKEETFSLPLPIGGTFIEWRIRDSNLITWNADGKRDN